MKNTQSVDSMCNLITKKVQCKDTSKKKGNPAIFQY